MEETKDPPEADDTIAQTSNSASPANFTKTQAKAQLEAALTDGALDGSVFTIHSLKVSKNAAAPPSAELRISRQYHGVQEAQKFITFPKWTASLQKASSFCRHLQNYYPYVGATLMFASRDDWETRWKLMLTELAEYTILDSQHSSVIRSMVKEYISEQVEPADSMDEALSTGQKTWWHSHRDPDDSPKDWPLVCVPHVYFADWADTNTAYKDVMRKISHSELHDGIEAWLTKLGVQPPCCEYVSLPAIRGGESEKSKVWLLPHITLFEQKGADLL